MKKTGKLFSIVLSILIVSQAFLVQGSFAAYEGGGQVSGPVSATILGGKTETGFDTRENIPFVEPTKQQLEAADQLIQSAGPGLKINWNSVFGTPSMILKNKGYLTEPANGDAETIARNWLKDHAALFGLTKTDIDALTVRRDYAVTGTGLRPVTFQQTFNGIESAHGGRIIVAVTKDGKILSVTANSRRSGELTSDFKLSAVDALSKVVSDFAPELNYVPKLTREEDGWKEFAAGNTLPTVQRVKKAVFLTNDKVIPAYRVLFIKELNVGYEVMVSAVTGEKLFQRSLVHNLEPEGLIFENYPGAPKGGDQIVRSFTGDPEASPNGWVFPLKNAGVTTTGNNANTYANWSNFLVPEEPGLIRPIDPLGHFYYGFADAWGRSKGQTVPPSYEEDSKPAITNLFYHHNLFHDYYYNLGWTEPAGNMQVNNFGKGGTGGDAVIGMAQAGATTGGAPTYTGRDNAYMLTNPDGISSWSGMFLWEPIPGAFNAGYSDGDFAASVIYHEYTHGMTTRLVAGGGSLNSFQSGAMGEAWGDFYAMQYLISHGYMKRPIEGIYVTENHETGIRNFALDRSPLNYGDIGYDVVGPEVHADGEIWADILWYVREALVDKLGEEKGGHVAEQLVIDAMPISVPNPSMIDMTRAIIASDVVRYNGAHYDTLWTAFAQKGLGVSASTNGGNDTNPHPGFDHPNNDRNGKLVAKVVNADTGKPVSDARIIVGDYEARVSPAVKTSDEGNFALPMVDGIYDITIQARGYGAQTLKDIEINAGDSNKMTIQLEPNLASSANGAEIDSVSSESSSNPVKNVIDDTEASVYASKQEEGDFSGAQFIVDLAGTKAVKVSKIQVSAYIDTGKSRFSALEDFTVLASKTGQEWTKIMEGSFPTKDPRPTAPQLHYKDWNIEEPVNARYLKLVAKHAQYDPKGQVQVAELQVFSAKKSKVEPLSIEPGKPFKTEGTIQAGNPGTGVGTLAGTSTTLAVTQNEFTTTQNPEPASQGIDGYVVTLPEQYGDGIHNIKVAGPGDGSYDLDVYFYNKDFELIGYIATASGDEVGVIPGGTKYAYVGLYTGANIPFTLTATSPY
ncbi:MAG TPA: M36 family metallopeptidase [Bacillales bacterium]|nr:M36 family metallopeptidase [Bacillales bacterium]